MAISRVKTWVSAETLTAADLNAEFDNIISGLDTDNIDDYSASVSEMRTTANPGEASSESQATDLTGEITRLRFALLETKQQIDSSITYWYESPTTGLITGPGSSTDNAIVRFDGTGGKTAQDSGVTIDDDDNVSFANAITVTGATTLNGAVTLGNASGDTITVTGTASVAETLTTAAIDASGSIDTDSFVGAASFRPDADDATPTASVLYKANILKAWAHLDLAGSGSVTVTDDHNITSSSYSGDELTVNITTNMANATYVALMNRSLPDSGTDRLYIKSYAAGSFICTGVSWSTAQDVEVLVAGDQ